jgi:hypothetical protein
MLSYIGEEGAVVGKAIVWVVLVLVRSSIQLFPHGVMVGALGCRHNLQEDMKYAVLCIGCVMPYSRLRFENFLRKLLAGGGIGGDIGQTLTETFYPCL